jgi:hypothetical protein
MRKLFRRVYTLTLEGEVMKRLAALLAAALGVATLALAQPINQSAPQPQPGPSSQSSAAPPPPSPSDPSMTTMQQPISGNSSATSPEHSMAPNAAEPNTRLAALLPRGMSPQEACNGFKSQTECAAAAHAAHNLNIPFGDLKSKMTSGQRLGAAIHELKPAVDAKSEAHRAEQQAHSDTQSPQG